MLFQQVKSIFDESLPIISNLANISAILNQMENINWCGFYLRKDNYLYLGPYQGDLACGKIMVGKGVCGTSFLNKQTIIVPNVHKFEGHIACSDKSNSEIVVPILYNDYVLGVIDIDSPVFNRFSDNEKNELELIANFIAPYFYK